MQDRTAEFKAAVTSLRSKRGFARPPEAAATREKSRFHTIARNIASQIASTYDKLEKLTVLASKRSLYDDHPLEIQELTAIVKQDINSLNNAISKLQEHVRDTQAKEKASQHKNKHSKNVVMSLQTKLASVSTKFKKVLETRTENLKAQKERRDRFSGTDPHMHTMAASAMPTLLGGDDAQHGGSVAIDMSQQSMEFAYAADTYVADRASAMQNIESTIAELGTIFSQLASMIREQGEQIERIDANVEEVTINVDAAHSELVRYLQNVSSNRWLMLKIFGVLIFFFLFFVIFMA